MPSRIIAESVASVSELKKNPMATVAAGEGFPVAVLNRNEPAFYCIPAKSFENLMERLEDLELAVQVNERRDQPEIEVNWDDL